MREGNAIVPNLPPSDRCCGCAACYAICPKGAITMCPDAEGFLQPAINHKACINCGKCENVCPVLNQGLPRTPLAVYAAKAKDDNLRRISSSGGVFSLLARQVLDKGGAVYGAAFEPPTHKVVHKRVTDEAGLDELRGSKYVQSDIGETYISVREDLESGKNVLFSGCPCQIAGLRRFLGKEYESLLLVDLICHAVPSPLAWQKYLSCQENKERAKITRTFSRRNCSWRKFVLSLEFVNSSDSTNLVNPANSSYLNAFCSELFNRKSCHACSFRGFKSGSDLTIGDFWGVEKKHVEIYDDMGVCAVMCSTRKGERAFLRIVSLIDYIPSTVDNVACGNKTVFGNHDANKRRERFFAEVNDTNFDDLVEELLTPPWWYRTLRWIKWHTIGKPKES